MFAGWRTRTSALVVVAVFVGACSAIPSPVPTTGAPAVLSPEASSCHDPSGGAPIAVVTIGKGASGAVLLVTSVAGYASVLHIDACRWDRAAAGIETTDSVGGTVLASAPPILSVDRGLTTGMEPIEHVLGGRSAPAVATVQITLSDGSVQNAVVSNGYWLAWWAGTQGSGSVIALDASGAKLSETPFTPESS